MPDRDARPTPQPTPPLAAGDAPHPLAGWAFLALAAAMIAGVVAGSARGPDAAHGIGTIAPGRSVAPVATPATPPPPVEPLELQPVTPAAAVAANAAIPFTPTAITAAGPLRFAGDEADRARAVDCLTTAVLYEAGDDRVGQQAVAQVILNRARHPAFPASVCGVVFQGSERRTGCQFTFTCDGALGRRWPDAAWTRARLVATDAIGGRVDPTVGLATHYHTDWVRPYWSDRLVKLVAVGTHLFFRWPGGWGERGVFRREAGAAEPAVAQLRTMFASHAGATPLAPPVRTAEDATRQALAVDARGIVIADRVSMIGTVAAARPSRPDGPTTRFAPSAAGSSPGATGSANGGATIHLTLDPAASAESHYALALAQCGDQSYCKVLGWTDPALRPSGESISDAQRTAMSFSYLRDQSTGLERALWNCATYPRSDRRQCMRR